MRPLRQKHNRKKLFIAGAIVIVLGASGYAVFAYSSHSWPFQKTKERTGRSIDYNPPTTEQKEAGDRTKQETIDKQDSTPPPQQPGKQNVEVTITSANQNGSYLQIRTLIHVLDNGTCTLTLQKGSDMTVTKTSSVQTLANSSTCQGFNVKTSELAPGKWSIQLEFEGSKYKGLAKSEVAIE